MRPGSFAISLLFCCGLLSSQGALAQALTAEDGRLLASNCFQCHGTNGKAPSGGFDTLAGESAREIYGELKEMQAKFAGAAPASDDGDGAGEDAEEEIMQVHVTAYSDAELWALSTFFSTQRKKSVRK